MCGRWRGTRQLPTNDKKEIFEKKLPIVLEEGKIVAQPSPDGPLRIHFAQTKSLATTTKNLRRLRQTMFRNLAPKGFSAPPPKIFQLLSLSPPPKPDSLSQIHSVTRKERQSETSPYLPRKSHRGHCLGGTPPRGNVAPRWSTSDSEVAGAGAGRS